MFFFLIIIIIISLAASALAAAETSSIFEEIRGTLSAGERALQSQRWREASEFYEHALERMRRNSLLLNVAAESQLYNNVGWAAFKLGDYERALRRFEAGARSCDVALDEGFSECADKVYENLHELLHKSLGRRKAAIAWMRQGVAATTTAGRGGDVVRARLGYLLLLEDDLDEAERVLSPLLAKSSTAARSVQQEAAAYVAWARALRRDWPSASDWFATSARLSLLPENSSEQKAISWRIQEGWFPPTSWRVHPLTTADVRVRLVEIPDAHLSGEDGAALWRGNVIFAGEHSCSGALPSDWGVPSEYRAERAPPAILLFDMREGHKMFWHHQTETVTKLCVLLSRIFDRNAMPPPGLPADTRTSLAAAVVVFPMTLGPTIGALLMRGHKTLRALNATNRLKGYEHKKGRAFRFDRAFLIDWPTPAAARWTPSSSSSSSYRRYHDSIFRLHYVPAPLLRLQAAFLKRAFPATTESTSFVLWYSRADCDKRHVVSEDAIVRALEDKFRGHYEVKTWRGGVTPDVERAARDWSRAALVLGPHGAGLANFVHCAKGTPILVLPARDAVGVPSSSDDYFLHAAKALGLRLQFLYIDSYPPLFFNYSAFSPAQIDAIVDAADAALSH
ncbi:hypothetical protein CTAYLR_010448 [Chrysophaeum taylorii]|uniref:Glycosyltransferase 61 catalytic domain-containing protein n=1 Tax=Chrysophaeum taylorii TaxID=2483200 RepID=A0AAD7U6R2_9STRA|nr:hypothetical protein CTAYLR_010448 [Chrysophaeum taylorii]